MKTLFLFLSLLLPVPVSLFGQAASRAELIATNNILSARIIATNSELVALINSVSVIPAQSLKLWLRADAGVTLSGRNVTRWADQSGNTNTFINESGTVLLTNNILGRYPVVRFEDAGTLIGPTNFLARATNITFIAVWSESNAVNNSSFGVSKVGPYPTSSEWQLRLTQSSNSLGYVDLGNQYITGDAWDAITGPPNYHVTTVTLPSGSEASAWGNGKALKPDASHFTGWSTFNNATNATTTAVRIGSAPGYSTGTGGDLAELLIWDRVLTTAERQQVEAYLMHKYFANLVVFAGNSLWNGSSSGTTNTMWRPPPTAAGPLLSNRWAIINVSTGGISTLTMLNYQQKDVLPLFDGFYHNKIAAFWEWSNDISTDSDTNAVLSRGSNYCYALRAAGFKTMVLTVLPRATNTTSFPEFATLRTNLNAMIRAQWPTFADALVDVAADTRIGDTGDETDTTYYLTDLVHLNNSGALIVATNLAQSIEALASGVIPLTNGVTVSAGANVTVTPSVVNGRLNFAVAASGNFSTNSAGTAELGRGGDAPQLNLYSVAAQTSNVLQHFTFGSTTPSFAIDPVGNILSAQLPRVGVQADANFIVANNNAGGGYGNSRTNKEMSGANGITVHHTANAIVVSNSFNELVVDSITVRSNMLEIADAATHNLSLTNGYHEVVRTNAASQNCRFTFADVGPTTNNAINVIVHGALAGGSTYYITNNFTPTRAVSQIVLTNGVLAGTNWVLALAAGTAVEWDMKNHFFLGTNIFSIKYAVDTITAP